MNKGRGKTKAFTLVEVLLAVSLIIAIGGISISVNQNLNLKNDLEIATISTAQTVRKAQMLSREGYRDSRWGVKIQTGELTLYKGESYELRDANFDEKIVIPSGIEISGANDFNFSKLDGAPQQSGNLNLKIKPYENNISVNEKGTVSY